MSFPNTIEIKETVSSADPGMVTVTIDVDARFATVDTENRRVSLTMRLPREAWPGVLGSQCCASCGGVGMIDAPMEYDTDGSPCNGPRECGACQGRGR